MKLKARLALWLHRAIVAGSLALALSLLYLIHLATQDVLLDEVFGARTRRWQRLYTYLRGLAFVVAVAGPYVLLARRSLNVVLPGIHWNRSWQALRRSPLWLAVVLAFLWIPAVAAAGGIQWQTVYFADSPFWQFVDQHAYLVALSVLCVGAVVLARERLLLAVLVVILWSPPLWTAGRVAWRELLDGCCHVVLVVVLCWWICVCLFARWRVKRPGHWRPWLAFGFGAVLSVTVLAGPELYFRLNLQTDGLGADQLSTLYWFRIYPRHNSDHFRDREFDDDKPPHTIRLAVIGDSVVFGHGIKDVQDRFSNLLESRLNSFSHGPRYQVYNLARCAANPNNYFKFLGTARRVNADLALIVHCMNDIEAVASLPVMPKQDSWWLARQTRAHSFLWSYLSHSQDLLVVFNKGSGKADPPSYIDWLVEQYSTNGHWNEYQQVLTELFGHSQGLGIPAILVIHPFLALVDDYPPGLAEIHQRLQRTAAAVRVPTIDLLDIFAGRDPRLLMVNHRDRHPNEHAHRLTAAYLFEQISSIPAESLHSQLLQTQHQ